MYLDHSSCKGARSFSVSFPLTYILLRCVLMFAVYPTLLNDTHNRIVNILLHTWKIICDCNYMGLGEVVGVGFFFFWKTVDDSPLT